MYKLLLIWRYFLRKHVALIAVAAVMLLVMLVLVVLSVMAGLLADTRERNHRWAGDVVVSRDSLVGFPYYEEFMGRLAKDERIAGATPVIRTFGLAGRSGRSAQVYGVRLAEFCRVTGFVDTLHYQGGRSEASFRVPESPYFQDEERRLTEEQRQRGCIVGIYAISGDREEVAEYRTGGLRPEAQIRWPLTVFGLNSRGQLAGSGLGEHQDFWYVDDSDSGLPDVDLAAVYADFGQIQRLCFMDGRDGTPSRANEIRIKLREGVGLEAGRRAVAEAWGQFLRDKDNEGQSKLLADATVQGWPEYRRSHIAPAEKEKSLMIVVFLMIGVVAVFIIFAIFYMIVTEKVRDLGIIKSVGGSGWSVGQIFLGYGMWVGLIGAAAGTVLGTAIVRHSNEIEGWLNKRFGFRLWDPAVYAISRIPDEVDYGQAAIIATVAVLACLAGAALPAWRAARLQVVEALRVE